MPRSGDAENSGNRVGARPAASADSVPCDTSEDRSTIPAKQREARVSRVGSIRLQREGGPRLEGERASLSALAMANDGAKWNAR